MFRARRGQARHDFFVMQTVQTDRCVLWPYSLNTAGYGQLNIDRYLHRVHRLSCEMEHGDPPTEHHEAAHSCRNRHCFNPRHLRWATRLENDRDKTRDGTDNKGEKHGMAKLTDDSVRAIRQLSAEGWLGSTIAERFGVTPMAVSNVLSGKSWSHVHGPARLPMLD